MALQIFFEDLRGVTHPVAYYMVGIMELNYIVSYGLIEVHGFHDQASRVAKKQNVDIHKIVLSGPVFEQLLGIATVSQEGNNPVAAIYTYLKTLEKFSNAIDV